MTSLFLHPSPACQKPSGPIRKAVRNHQKSRKLQALWEMCVYVFCPGISRTCQCMTRAGTAGTIHNSLLAKTCGSFFLHIAISLAMSSVPELCSTYNWTSFAGFFYLHIVEGPWNVLVISHLQPGMQLQVASIHQATWTHCFRAVFTKWILDFVQKLEDIWSPIQCLKVIFFWKCIRLGNTAILTCLLEMQDLWHLEPHNACVFTVLCSNEIS